MARDVLTDFLNPQTDERFTATEGYIDTNQEPVAPTRIADKFSVGVQAGAQGMAADLEYFEALIDTMAGDKQAAEAAVSRAKVNEELAAAPKAGMETFQEFIDNPTLDGFFTQAITAVGEVTPSAISTIASAGAGGITARLGMSLAGKKVAERIARDAVARTARNVATQAERELAEAIYSSTRTSMMKKGGLAGAFASEYAPLSGGNLGEALESGQDLNRSTAARAGLVAAPQAALGVGGEVAILKAFGKVAKQRAVKEGDLFSKFAKNISTGFVKAGAIEGTVEAGQEAIGAANRMQMDDTYTAQDAQMRLGQAAFMGFFGGGAAGGAGGIAATAVQNSRELGDRADAIFQKATDMVDQMRDRQLNDQIDGEQYGDIMSGYTTPESDADIAAQIRAMHDPSSTKQAVWDASEEPKFGARRNRVTPVSDQDGNRAFAAFIPGRGTIISTSQQIVEDVIASRGSDRVLAAALGYSASKSEVAGGDIVVQALDAQGNVVSEEVTNEANVQAAINAAEGLKPEGGSVSQTTVDVALEERRKRSSDRGYSDMDLSDEVLAGLGYSKTLDETGNVTISEQQEPTKSEPFAPKRDKNEFFPNTASTRQAFSETFADVFGDIKWDDDFFGGMSEAFMKNAIDMQLQNPTSDVQVQQTEDGKYELVLDQSQQDQDNASTNAIIARTLDISRNSRAARNSQFRIVTPKGVRVPVAFNSLVITGKQLLNAQGINQPSNKDAITAAIAELQLGGYDLDVNGESFFNIGNGPIPSNMDVAVGKTADGKNVTLSDILSNKQKQAAPKSDLKYISETDAFFQFPEIFDAVDLNADQDTRLAAYEAALNERGFTSEESKAGPKKGYDYFDPATAEDVVFDGGEIAQMQEQVGVNEQQAKDSPKTRLNVEEGDPFVEQRGDARATPSTGPVNPQTTEAAPTFEELGKNLLPEISAIVTDLLNAVNLDTEVSFVQSSDLLNMSDAQLRELAGNDIGYEALRQTVEDFRNKPSLRGRHVYITNQPVIIVNDQLSPLDQALTIAHEIGHGLFRQEMKNAIDSKVLHERLVKAFESHPYYDRYLQGYSDPSLAFEEWYADQVGIYAFEMAKEKGRGKYKPVGGVAGKHFKTVAERLQAIFNKLKQVIKDRFGVQSADFAVYMDEVIEAAAQRRSAREASQVSTEPSFQQLELAMAVREQVDKAVSGGGNGGNGNGGSTSRSSPEYSRTSRLLDKLPYPLRAIFFTADSMLRAISPEIADMFYVRAQETGKGGRVGMLRAVNLQMGEFKNRFEDEVGNLNDQAVKDAIEEASSSTPTAELSPAAQNVRRFLESVYDEYIASSNSDIQRQENYFPVVLDLLEIAQRADEFKTLILANNPELSPQQGDDSLSRIMRTAQSMQSDDVGTIDPTNPNASAVKSINLTKGIDRQVLADAGFLQSPDTAFISYMHSLVKKVEFDRATGGPEALRTRIEQLSTEEQAQVREILNAYMGYNSKPLSPFMRKLNSWGQFLQFVTILPFATVASLPDLAGPVINSKEFGALETGFKEIVRTIKNRQEAEELARQLGVVTSETVANAWVTEAEKDFMDPAVRNMSDAFFKYIGLDYFTKFSREFASNMGVQFLLKHSTNPNEKSARYLDDLGLTAADVNAWETSGRDFTSPEGRKVQKALQRFVESSILRPNAAERPIWASDPRFALIWQLKSYFYAYHQTITKGVLAERRTRLREAGGDQAARLTANASILLLTAMATMPLAMLGMELREWMKFGLGTVVGKDRPTRYFRSDKMEWGTYINTIFDKSGFYGPMSMLLMAQQSQEWGRSGIVSLLGPTAETLETTMRNGWRIDKTVFDRLMPVSSWL